MNTLLLTLTKSGSNFAARLLTCTLGLDGNQSLNITIDEEVDKDMACDYCALHATQPFPDDLFDAIIITLRHPHSVLASLKKQDETTDVNDLALNWQTLVQQVSRFDKKLFLTIDGDPSKRAAQVDAIAAHFNSSRDTSKFVSDWKPAWVNKRNRPGPPVTDVEKLVLAPAVEVYEQWQ